MTDFDPLPTADDASDDVDSFAASPFRYMVDATGMDPRGMGFNRYEFGPATLDGPLFVCPGCGIEDDVEVHGVMEVDDSIRATSSCPNCDWEKDQQIDCGTDD
jgi:hypothetical protein